MQNFGHAKMNKPTNIKVAIVSTGIILSFIFAFVLPCQPKETQAQFGVTFNIKLKDLAKKPRTLKEIRQVGRSRFSNSKKDTLSNSKRFS